MYVLFVIAFCTTLLVAPAFFYNAFWNINQVLNGVTKTKKEFFLGFIPLYDEIKVFIKKYKDLT